METITRCSVSEFAYHIDNIFIYLLQSPLVGDTEVDFAGCNLILDNTEGKVVRLEEQLGELVAYSRGIEARFAKMQLLQQAAAIARLDRFEDAFNLSCRKRIVV